MAGAKPKKVQRSVRIPVEEYQALKETLEVLQDRELAKSIRRGLEDIRKGQTISQAQVLKTLRSR